jgi:hypothetical protein
VLEEYWIAGAPEQSCTDACAADGRTCVADAALPTTSGCFAELSSLPHINIACDSHAGISPSTAPGATQTPTPNYITQLGATGCYHLSPAASPTWTFSCDKDIAGYPSFRRLCPCTHHPSPPPPGPYIYDPDDFCDAPNTYLTSQAECIAAANSLGILYNNAKITSPTGSVYYPQGCSCKSTGYPIADDLLTAPDVTADTCDELW